MIETWVFITILACFFQNLRSLFQKLLQEKLSNLGATYTRFGYGLPFVIFYFCLLIYLYDYGFPSFNFKFVLFCVAGGISQIIATYLLLKTFLLRNFAVANAYSKTEPIQAIFLSVVILNEKISIVGLIAIIIAVIGVLIFSITRRTDFNFNYGTLIGILSGTLFGIAAVCFRGASLSLDHDIALMSSATTLLIAISIQTMLFTFYLVYKEPMQIILSIKNFKYSLIVGFTGASASMCWFYCMAIQNVAYVRALGQIELLFSLIISFFYLKEKIKPNEVMGLLLMLFGIVLILVYVK